MRIGPFVSVSIVAVAFACSSDPPSADPAIDAPNGGASDASAPEREADAAARPDAAAESGDAGGELADPALAGPFAVEESETTVNVASTGDEVPVRLALPKGTTKVPLLVFAPGFRIEASQYLGYVRHAASHGYASMVVAVPTSLLGNDNTRQANDMIGAADWAGSAANLGGRVDASRVVFAGHSLGGKLALLAGSLAPARTKAIVALDPVDSGGPSGCSAPCVVVKEKMSTLNVPALFVGETTDAEGTFNACAPAADNYVAFFSRAKAPSVEVTALGANHMSFVDDVAACGLTCSLCKPATAAAGSVAAMSRAFLVAFAQRHVGGMAAADAYLTGAVAQSRYVATGAATIRSK